MRKIYSQVFYDLKKDRTSYLSFGIIILVTAFILNCAITLFLQVDKAYDEKFDRLQTALVNVCIPKVQNDETLSEDMSEIAGVVQIESHEAIFSEAVVKEFKNADFSMNTVFYNFDTERNLNRYDVIEESKKSVGNPIYIPLYVSEFGEFSLNDEIVYEIDGTAYRFTVAGIIEEMQYGNYGMGLMCAYLPEEIYNDLVKRLQSNEVMEYSLCVENGVSLDDVRNEINGILKNSETAVLSSCDSQSAKSTRTMVCDLLILILVAFAAIVLIVSIFLSNFRVRNAIEAELVNMSVLKALGYTGGQIVASVTLPYTIVTVLFTLIGVISSYTALPVLAQVLSLQSGFSFQPDFDVRSLLCVEIILVSVVTLFTFLAARKIKKIQAIDGLRGNTGGKGSKKNYFPLSETKGNTQVLLIMKQILVCRKQNVLLFLVSFVLTVLVAFSGTLFYNVVVKLNNFMSALSEETPDVIITSQMESQGELKKILEGDEEVEKALQYVTSNFKMDDIVVTAFVCEDFSQVKNDLCYEGKNPEKADEIALGSAFQENYRIGDTVSISNDEKIQNFKVTGFIQSVNCQGEVCELSYEGYASMYDEINTSTLYVYLQDTVDAAKFIESYEENYADIISSVSNAQKMQEEAQDMYMGITVILVVFVFAISVLVVLFILYIVIKSLLIKRKQELGIYKAMGYSNLQLIIQTVGSFMPISIVATLLSSAAALAYMPYIYQLIFEAIGAIKNSMEVSFGFLMIFAMIQIIINLMISIILCMPIRKISAYSLIRE